MRIIILLMVTAVLYGCESSVVNELKETRLPGYPTYTIDQAFGNRAVCGDVTWTVAEDSRGRTMVTYRCDMAKVKDFESEYLQEAILVLEKLNERPTPAKGELEDRLKKQGDFWNADEPDAETIDRLQKEHEKYAADRKERIAAAISTLETRHAEIEPHFTEFFQWVRIADNQFQLESGGYSAGSVALGKTDIDYSGSRGEYALALLYKDVANYEEYLELSGIKEAMDYQISDFVRFAL